LSSYGAANVDATKGWREWLEIKKGGSSRNGRLKPLAYSEKAFRADQSHGLLSPEAAIKQIAEQSRGSERLRKASPVGPDQRQKNYGHYFTPKPV
jgi:hypothetical protein